MGENLAIISKDYLSLYGESNLLKSLILYVDLDSTRTPEERNLAAVYQMLTQHTEKELTMLFDRLPIGHPAKGPYSLFSQASDTVRAGIVLGLGTRLQVLQSEAVRRITRSSDIDLSEPGWSKCAYYIILDDQNSSLEFLSACSSPSCSSSSCATPTAPRNSAARCRSTSSWTR